jgi:hypothetical protein
MGLLEIGWSDVDWIGLAQDRDKWRTLVNVVMNIQVPYTGKLSSGYTIGGLSSSSQFHRFGWLVKMFKLFRVVKMYLMFIKVFYYTCHK